MDLGACKVGSQHERDEEMFIEPESNTGERVIWMQDKLDSVTEINIDFEEEPGRSLV